jgi:glycine/D-amino acid oxidase-like deaminating enzyme
VTETRVGFRPVACGDLPMLGATPGVAGLLIGNGLGAAGLTIRPRAGRLPADMALRRPGEIDATAFAPVWGRAGRGGVRHNLR